MRQPTALSSTINGRSATPSITQSAQQPHINPSTRDSEAEPGRVEFTQQSFSGQVCSGYGTRSTIASGTCWTSHQGEEH